MQYTIQYNTNANTITMQWEFRGACARAPAPVAYARTRGPLFLRLTFLRFASWTKLFPLDLISAFIGTFAVFG